MKIDRWYHADAENVAEKVFEYVGTVERDQQDIYDLYHKLEALYDPRCSGSLRHMYGAPTREAQTVPEDNLIASNVDTVTSAIAATEVRPRFMTDGADWSTQRRARHLELYAEGLAKLKELDRVMPRIFKDAALTPTGVVKVYEDWICKDVRVERVLGEDVIVDEAECKAGDPRQMHHRMFVDRDVLAQAFPDHDEAIYATTSGGSWADYRELEHNEIVVIESWYLARGGPAGEDSHQHGRHTIVIDGTVLLDEHYHEFYFPFAVMRWSERRQGWYGISGAERIVGHQNRANRLRWVIARQHDQHAVPTTYVQQADANITIRSTNRLGTFAVYRGSEPPKTVIPPGVNPETYAQLKEAQEAAFNEFGVSMLAAQAKKPAGLESGAALREYVGVTTQRFSQQEKAYERFYLDVIWLMIACCKKLGKDAPEVFNRRYQRRIKWGDVDMGEVKVQISAAGTLSRTPAGRQQMVLEWAQAGLITPDEARTLYQHPDLERTLSLYTAALDDIERAIENMLDGELEIPEPMQNLALGVRRLQMAYLKARNDGAPEEVLETLRQWMVQAIAIQNMGQKPAAPMAGPGAEMMGEPGMDAVMAPAPGMEMPGAPPVSAIAPEAIGVAPA